MVFKSILMIASAVLLSGAALPRHGPVPAPRSEAVAAEKNTPETSTEKPADAPSKAKADTLENKGPEQPEKTVPTPTPPPTPTPEDGDASKPQGKAADAPEILSIEPEKPEAYAACIAALKAIGTTFREEKRIDDGGGCGIDKPLSVTAVLPGIDLKPEGTMRCETALELARWTKEAVLPAAETAVDPEGSLTTINQASSYICRLRNNAATGKISEHARGNAVDIASFTFKSGKTIEIQPRDEDATLTGAFQRAVTASGCLYFETVLDPGSDEAHENHLHFDVLQRKNGYRYCR